MKNALRYPSLILVAGLILFGCTKESAVVENTVQPVVSHPDQKSYQTLSRFSGPNYSKPISLTTANSMIASYLASVNYPNVDTAIRSFSFDADTLRAYLQDTGIVTIKFFMAHNTAYKSSNYGQYAGMNPGALTMVIVGQDQSDNYITNSQNQVYDYIYSCPTNCDSKATPYISN